ncbi:MAG TPA: hypothetical protein ENH10_10090 [Bacteroidetes bacterium]|nr:hypothetical protein BMS3Bbin04_00414 [bacterium BMS3Bbin04]HDO66356.1 hypothetical protein [Bacteroidota bacterium]HEX05481.1 hypothetical protein [Bacteroidota bacterium]
MNNTRPLNIVKICARHHPLDGRVFHLEAATLRDAGHHVTIIAPNPGNLRDKQTIDGIDILTFNKSGNRLTRKLNTLRSLFRLAISINADVYHAHEVDAALIAGALAKRHHIRRGRWAKLVFDVHEVWPYFYAAATNSSFLRRIIVHGILEYENWMLARHVDLVIAAHVLETNYYRWQNPFISVRHVQTTMKVPDTCPTHSGDVKVIGHEGFFTLNRGMDVILQAFELVARDYPDVILQTAGDFYSDKDRKWFGQWAERTGLGDRVKLTGWLDRPDLTPLLKKMDIGIVAQREDDHTSRTWPLNKLMNYAGYGVASVVCASMPYAKQEVEERGMGRVINLNAQDLYQALCDMIESPEKTREMGVRAWEFAHREWNWERYRVELLRAYEDLMEPTYRPRKTVKLQG